MNGIIVVDKPQEFTSFDVCAKLRGILHEKRIGHTGTLDPMATGVLPILVGKATKASDILPIKEKIYRASFKLGILTDTGDIWGNIVKKCFYDVTEIRLKSALSGFVGEISQIPPMYSAVSVGGKRLYSLARQGIEVKREPRRVTVFSLDITRFDEKSGEGELLVSCSKGTYIRTLVEDIAKTLGTEAALTALRRESTDGFSLADAHTIDELQRLCDEKKLENALLPTDSVFSVYPAVTLDEHCTGLYKNGVALRRDQVKADLDGRYRVYGADSEFLGLADIVSDVKQYKNFY